MSKTQISDPSVVVNNIAVNVVPNSVEFMEGFGEQEMLVQSAGGGVLEQVYSNNVETNIGGVKFAMRSTIDNIKLARGWKSGGAANVIAITTQTPEGSLTRTFNSAAVVNDYGVALSADGVIELEWKAEKATI